MQDVFFVIAIVDRTRGERFERLFREDGVSLVMSMPGEGTAATETLRMLGLEATEKAVLFSVASGPVRHQLMHDMVFKMCIDAPGAGIALSVPVDSIGGSIAKKGLLDDYEPAVGEEKVMKETAYSLIVVIANRGRTDMVMDAARSANATGGTVLHVKGAGAAHAEKFFGMSIADEKEMILIATLKSHCSDIMKAIMTQAGVNTRAHALCFSMPIDSIAGFRMPIED